MIPFASQRGGGQNLATHLMNAHDNAQIELLEVRGAIARDLHGAFAEWAALARGLTRARQYLFSLSINPDQLQGRLTRAQYLDYIDRTERRLGLARQPRAIVFHRKKDASGHPREHCHVVWSRTLVAEEKAVPLSFFKEKLMTVTREFARDHGLTLPDGYHRQEDALRRRNRQLTSYDCVKQKETGISHAERMAAVTGAWQRSDSAKAFVRALEDLGYMLARGRNSTRVVLVDYYGHTTALTRLIDDAAVRARDVRAFLGAAYAPENLPSAEQAQEHAAQRRMVMEAFEKARTQSEQVAQLLAAQAIRRRKVEARAAKLRRRQHRQRLDLAAEHKAARQGLQAAYLAELKHVRIHRSRRAPRGLAAFLARVSGIALLRKKIQRSRDRRRFHAYLGRRERLKRDQQRERESLARRHWLQATEIRCKLRALEQIEQRERETQDLAARQERRKRINGRHRHMPSLAPALRLKTGMAAPEESGQASRLPFARVFAQAAEPAPDGGAGLADVFARASGSRRRPSGKGESEQEGDEDSGDIRRDANGAGDGHVRVRFANAATGEQGEDENGDAGSDLLKPASEPKAARRHHRKKKPVRKARAGKTGQSHAFNDAAGGGEGESGDDTATTTLAPAAGMKMCRRRKRRPRNPDHQTDTVSGGDDSGADGDDAGGESRRRKRRRSRGPDPPEEGGPPRPRRKRKPSLKPGGR